MNKFTTALGAMAIATPTLADIPDTPECQPLNDMVTAFSERFEQGILPANFAPQIENYYSLVEREVNGADPEELAPEAYAQGQILAMKGQMAGLQRFQLQYLLQQVHLVVAQCIESQENA